MSPHVRPPIGHPPPLISSGMSSQPSTTQLMSHKKEGSHAGGSILQGTSATHGPPPPSGSVYILTDNLSVVYIMGLTATYLLLFTGYFASMMTVYRSF